MTAHSVPIQEQKQQLGFSAKHLWFCTASQEMLCQGGIWNHSCCGTDGSWSFIRKIPTPGLCCSCAEFFWVYTLGQHNRNCSLSPGLPRFGGFPASLLLGISCGGLIVATAVPQIQGLAPLITSVGSGVSSSRKYRNSSGRVPRQGRVDTHLWKFKAPWPWRQERSCSAAGGHNGHQKLLEMQKHTSKTPTNCIPAPGVSVPPALCASTMYRVEWEGLGSSTSI